MFKIVILTINDSFGVQITELRIIIKDTGEYYTIWQIPTDLEAGTYHILVNDGFSDDSVSLIIN